METKIKWRSKDIFNADLKIGYKIFREKFNSTVTLQPHSRITVNYENGPFVFLKNHWEFFPKGKTGSTIEFFIDFEFRTGLMNGIIQPIFEEATKRMVNAFEARARKIYA